MKSYIQRTAFILWLVVLLQPLGAQRLDPAKWTLTLEPAAAAPGSTVLGRLEVTLEDDWHVYSPTTPAGGPIPTSIELADNDAVASYEVFQQEPVTKPDPAFGINTETYAGGTTFLYQIKLADELAAGEVELVAKVRYQLCNDTQCLPPKRKTAAAALSVDPSAPLANAAVPAGFVTARRDTAEADPAAPTGAVSSTPVTGAPAATTTADTTSDSEGLIQFLLVAFGFGLAALFTPCVFPMIPITVSFFINQETGSKRDSLTQALVFCFGIIGLFTALGLAATALLGPFGVVQLGSNPWVNGFIAVVFCAFGLSLLGAFEITLPSGLLTKLNAASQRQGYGGTLIMGLTFSLTAFACVGPFVGTLLAASIQGGGIRPLLGMTSFASGLALPFFFLALFPSYLQRMPRAGGWMSRVKVVLGFIVMAAMFKYLSNIDQVMQWELLTRERFLAIWIVLFAVPGLYLLGLLPMEGIERDEKAGVGRVLTGCAFLVFAISLIPGMLGARLGEIEAYIPTPSPQSALSSRAAGSELRWLKNSYPEALELARAEGKLVFVNFTGYACTNCHWMKANMFTRPEIADLLSRYVLLELYTDGTDAASSENQALQDDKFSTIAIPYYAIVAPDGSVVATFPGLTRKPEEFLAFLNGPLSR